MIHKNSQGGEGRKLGWGPLHKEDKHEQETTIRMRNTSRLPDTEGFVVGCHQLLLYSPVFYLKSVE